MSAATNHPVTEEDWLPRLAHDIASEHRQAQESAQTAIAHARRAGELLVQAKHRVVKHGEWAAWCEAELPFGERMAQRYMKVARELPRLSAQQAEQISEMSLRDVLKMLSVPKEPRNGKADSPKNKDLEPKTTRVSDLKPDVKSWEPAASEPEVVARRPGTVLHGDDLIEGVVEAALSSIFDDITDGDDSGLFDEWSRLPRERRLIVLGNLKRRINRLTDIHRRLGEK